LFIKVLQQQLAKATLAAWLMGWSRIAKIESQIEVTAVIIYQSIAA